MKAVSRALHPRLDAKRIAIIASVVLCETLMCVFDVNIPAIEFAQLSVVPILAFAWATNNELGIVFAAIMALLASLIETDPGPRLLTNPNVWANAGIFWCGYLVALVLMRLVVALSRRLHLLYEDLRHLKHAHDGLLPEQLPWPGEWEFAVLNVPRVDVGGCFYDMSAWKGGVDLFVANVGGPTMAASMLLSALKGLWFTEEVVPAASLRGLARRMRPVLRNEWSCRAWYGKLYNNGIVRYASAGFEAPFLVVPGTGEVRRLTGGGDPVGLAADGEVTESMYLLEGGSTLVLGNTGFCDLARQGLLRPHEVVADIDAARERVKSLQRKDDILAVVIRRKANFLFEHYFEEPTFEERPMRAARPRGQREEE